MAEIGLPRKVPKFSSSDRKYPTFIKLPTFPDYGHFGQFLAFQSSMAERTLLIAFYYQQSRKLSRTIRMQTVTHFDYPQINTVLKKTVHFG